MTTPPDNTTSLNQTNINWQPAFLEDALVTLVPLEPAHFDELFRAASDPLIWEQNPAHDRYKKEVFQVYFNSGIQSNSAFLIRDSASGKAIGTTRYYDYDPSQLVVTIGYTFLVRECWGGSYNGSVKKLMLDYAFQYVDHVRFQIGAGNIRSQKAVEKLGAVKVGEFETDRFGKMTSFFEYSLHKKDWK